MKRLVFHSKTIIIYEEKSFMNVFSGSKPTLARVEFEWKVGVSGVSGELWRGSQENKLWRLGRCWNWIEFLLTVKEGFCWEIFVINCHPHDMNSGDTRNLVNENDYFPSMKMLLLLEAVIHIVAPQIHTLSVIALSKIWLSPPVILYL